MKEILTQNLSPKEAIALQKELAQKIICTDQQQHITNIAGVDVAVNNKTNTARAALVVLSYPDLKLIEQQTHEQEITMPYIPGLLSFREIPSIIEAYKKLQNIPDLLLVDGMGIAHPRRIGIASHLGLLLNKPTIGCGKSLLIGTYNKHNLGSQAGSWVPLKDKQASIGAVLRTRTNTKPLFISPGHLISLETSISYVISCCTKYRLPEPIRLADKLSKFSHTKKLPKNSLPLK